ncbi:MAG: P-loop NTPase [Betaproteobacteria bacterium]|nr:P-loop NTPase [Betaproteobacteria bacterium]
MKTYRDIAGDGGSDVLGQVAEREARRRTRMALVARKFAVMSGKGGVGKSMVTVNLAAALALRGHRVGILDADINGPCVAQMLGVRDRMLKLGAGGVAPVEGPLGIKVVSMDLLLPGGAVPVIWNAPMQQHRFTWLGAAEAGALGEFLADTLWGELDFLLIDLPPGPERYPDFHDLLPECDGAIVVTIPSGVAMLTVKRSIVLAQTLQAKVFGVVENMAGYQCEQCGALQALFAGEGESTEQTPGVPVLGRIPFDPRITRCCDQGVPFVSAHHDTPAAQAIMEIAVRIGARCAAWGGGR